MNETQLIKMSRLELNHGQIPGLPGNPRQWTQADVNRLAQSLKDTPELFEARPIIAVPHDGKLVILGGNMRYCASKYNGAKEVRFIRGRLHFNEAENAAPFPSMVVIFEQ